MPRSSTPSTPIGGGISPRRTRSARGKKRRTPVKESPASAAPAPAPAPISETLAEAEEKDIAQELPILSTPQRMTRARAKATGFSDYSSCDDSVATPRRSARKRAASTNNLVSATKSTTKKPMSSVKVKSTPVRKGVPPLPPKSRRKKPPLPPSVKAPTSPDADTPQVEAEPEPAAVAVASPKAQGRSRINKVLKEAAATALPETPAPNKKKRRRSSSKPLDTDVSEAAAVPLPETPAAAVNVSVTSEKKKRRSKPENADVAEAAATALPETPAPAKSPVRKKRRSKPVNADVAKAVATTLPETPAPRTNANSGRKKKRRSLTRGEDVSKAAMAAAAVMEEMGNLSEDEDASMQVIPRDIPAPPESPMRKKSIPAPVSTPESPMRKKAAPAPPKAVVAVLEEKQMAVNVHRFRYAAYIPNGILRLCATPPGTGTDAPDPCPYLAVSREGGAVELVSPCEKYKCIAQVEGMRNRNIDAMAWLRTPTSSTEDMNMDTSSGDAYFCSDHATAMASHSSRKLYGASRDGTIFHINFSTKRHSGIIGSGGGAVFCLVTMGDLLAAGCEDGSVRLYAPSTSTEPNAPCLELVSTLPSVGAAVISIACLPGAGMNSMEGSILYAGVSDGTIRKFVCSSAVSRAKLTGHAPHAISTGAVLSSTSTSRESFSSLQWKSTLRMTVENRGRRSATKIWTVQALKDGTVISGDSMGQVHFWDGNAGTLLQSIEHNSLNGDVLDLAVSRDEKIMASGVDSKVICIERAPGSSSGPGGSKWVMTNQQRSHTHDVNSLAMVYTTDTDGHFGTLNHNGQSTSNSAPKVREWLVSGGVDTKVCSYLVAKMRKYRPQIAYKYPTRAPIVLSRKVRMLSIMRSDKVDFFQLARMDNSEVVPDFSKALDEDKAYLGSVSITSLHNLISFDVSDDGKYLAVSNAVGLLLFQLDLVDSFNEDGEKVQLLVPRKVTIPEDSNISVACSTLKWGKDGLLVCATASGPIHLVRVEDSLQEDSDDDVSSAQVTLEDTFTAHMTTSATATSLPVNQLTLSENGRWMAAGRNIVGKSCVEVFSLQSSSDSGTASVNQHWWTLPCMEAPHSCIKFIGEDDVDPALVVACNNGVVYLFDVGQRQLSDWSQDVGFPSGSHLPRELALCPDCPDSLAFNTATPEKIIMGGHTWFTSIDLSKRVPLRSKPFPTTHFKAKKWSKSYIQERQRCGSFSDKLKDDLKRDETNRNFTICLRYSGIIFQDFLDKNEMVVVEQPWLGIVNSLPDALFRQRYGA